MVRSGRDRGLPARNKTTGRGCYVDGTSARCDSFPTADYSFTDSNTATLPMRVDTLGPVWSISFFCANLTEGRLDDRVRTREALKDKKKARGQVVEASRRLARLDKSKDYDIWGWTH